MNDALPDSMNPRHSKSDRRIVLTAALSVALHLALIGWLVLPRLQLPEPTEPPAITVDLVLPELGSSVEPASSSVPQSSQEPESSEPESSAAASSAEAASSAAAAPASSVAPPEPPARGRPVVIPVGPSEMSSEPESSAASEIASAEAASAASEVSALSTTDAGAADAIVETSASEAVASASAEPAPPITGALHTAKRFYLDAILGAPAMARARDAIKKLPPEKRLTQTCNIEAVGQVGNAGRGFEPDALVADAFAPPAIDTGASSVSVSGGAFRSGQKWYGIAYSCTLGKDLASVKSFSYRIGEDVTAALKPRLGG